MDTLCQSKWITYQCEKDGCDNMATRYLSEYNRSQRHYCSNSCRQSLAVFFRDVDERKERVTEKLERRRLFIKKYNKYIKDKYERV